MKKLTGMKKNFSSLENKKLSNPSSIVGGFAEPTNDQRTEATCTQNCADTKYLVDGVSRGTTMTTSDCP